MENYHFPERVICSVQWIAFELIFLGALNTGQRNKLSQYLTAIATGPCFFATLNQTYLCLIYGPLLFLLPLASIRTLVVMVRMHIDVHCRVNAIAQIVIVLIEMCMWCARFVGCNFLIRFICNYQSQSGKQERRWSMWTQIVHCIDMHRPHNTHNHHRPSVCHHCDIYHCDTGANLWGPTLFGIVYQSLHFDCASFNVAFVIFIA